MRHAFIVLLTIFSFNLFANDVHLNQDEINFVSSSPEIKIALMPDFSPFSFIEDVSVVGFENDLLELLGKKTGLKFQKHYGVWNENLKAFQEKKVDMISSISYKKERESFVSFTKPYYEIPIMIFVRDDFEEYRGLQSLKGKKVGILKDVFYTKELQEFKDIELAVYETYEEITRALVFGKIDALIQNLPNINYLIKKNLYSNLRLVDELHLSGITKEDLRFGINPNTPLLYSIVQKALDSITKEEWQKLIDQWIDVKYNDYLNTNKQNRSTLTLTIDEIDFMQSNIIKYCINPNLEPIEYLDKQENHNGLTKDYLDAIVKKTGMRVKFVKTKHWSETVQFLENRSCDMALAIAPTPSNEKYFLFTPTYLAFPQVVAMHSNVPFINTINELMDKKIGVVKDYAIAEILKLKYPQFKIVPIESLSAGLKKVSSGDMDAIVDFLPSISRAIHEEALGNIKIAGKIDEMVKLTVASRSDNPLLHSIMQKSIQSFQPEEHKAILDKWLTIKYEYGTDYTLVWIIALGALFSLVVFGYWNHKITEAKKTIEQQNKQLEILATTDKLTKIYNRAKLDDLLQNEMERAKRYNHSFGCALIDIDHFKKINDTHGHLMGDKVLQQLASLINTHTRKSDIFGRWGGEEFLLILPETNAEDMMTILEKIRLLVAKSDMLDIDDFTISIGTTLYVLEDSIDSLIKRADDALYEAKNSGRNKVVML